MSEQPHYKHFKNIRGRLYTIVFGTDTPAGKLFDVVLLWVILASIIVVILESVESYKAEYGALFKVLEWTFTVLFTIEYATRIFISKRPANYIFSYWGLIDLLALLPTYLTIFVSGGSYLVVIRGIRLLRVFRILKLTRYISEAEILGEAMKASRRKILVFLGAVSTLVVITGTLMYLIEGGENGFTSIPTSIYWAVVTITTVGYGDIAPQTVIGQAFATLMMLTGYAIIAVPTGIMTSELSRAEKRADTKYIKVCDQCGGENPLIARYCNSCGNQFKTKKAQSED